MLWTTMFSATTSISPVFSAELTVSPSRIETFPNTCTTLSSLELLGVPVRGAFRVEYDLRYSLAVAKVHEYYSSVVAHRLYPSDERDLSALVGGGELVAIICAFHLPFLLNYNPRFSFNSRFVVKPDLAQWTQKPAFKRPPEPRDSPENRGPQF